MADAQAELLRLYRDVYALREERDALQSKSDSLTRDLSQKLLERAAEQDAWAVEKERLTAKLESSRRDARQSAAEVVQLKEDNAAFSIGPTRE
ncbi:hypothetical protein EXIGLDRAFT_70884 [Exidia glandulosa HHB12029]|uniref:Uncharacterized protein n=1 Tax=Exidia glandulosa HHB12029 TaxID=1314781 RepID=A0A165HY90_EXIGL|nr:hypothetical protein EXIGLDRAFT_70884 [Exidia glandulosa HHB12029]